MKPVTLPCNKRLFTLESISTQELQPLYLEAVGMKPPHKASARYLRTSIAWHLQAIEAGHDPQTLRKTLIEKFSTNTRKPSPKYQPGTRLVREWQGQTHEVTIREKDFLWQGRAYSSLSAIATEITGTRWSGPRFFGLKAHRS